MAALPHWPRLGVALVVLAMAATEIGLRKSGVVGHELRSSPDARYGYTLIPGQDLISERGIPLSINSQGFRDREWTDQDQASTRVAVFGDSVTFGRDVAPEALWCRLLESRLCVRKSAGRNIVVQNFAVPGYLLEQYERVFDDMVAPTRPSLVVFTLAPYSIWPMQVRKDSAFVPLRRWLLGTAIFECIDRVRRDIRDEGIVIVRRDAHGTFGADPHAPENGAHWDKALERLDRVRAAVESWGGRLVLVSMPVVEAILVPEAPSRFEAWAAQNPSVLWIDPKDALTSTMQPLLREMAEKHLVLDDVWKSRGQATTDASLVHADCSAFFLHDRYHMTELGHAVVAGVVGDALLEAGLP